MAEAFGVYAEQFVVFLLCQDVMAGGNMSTSFVRAMNCMAGETRMMCSGNVLGGWCRYMNCYFAYSSYGLVTYLEDILASQIII